MLTAIRRAELDLFQRRRGDIVGDGELFGTAQGMAARFLRPAYVLRAALAKLPVKES